jgi:MYXO-CTERM domain-containing protein
MTDLSYTQYEVTVSESDAASFAANQLASMTYATNIGPNAVVTRTGALSIPPGTLVGSSPQTFVYVLAFTTPYAYTSGTDIVITIRHSSGGTPAPDARVDGLTEAAGVSWGLFSSGAASATGQYGNAAIVKLITVPTPNIGLTRVGGLVDGGADITNASYAATPLPLTYTILNQGDAPLGLTGPNPVTLSGNTNCTFTIQQPANLTVAPAGQTTFMVTVTPTVLGPWSVLIEIANNDPDESPFDFTLSGTAASGSEITVLRGTLDIADGGVDFVGSGLSLVYTIRNDGNEDLDLTGGGTLVAISGHTNCAVSVAQPGQAVLATAATTTFTLTVTPAAAGAFNFNVSIANDDADENPFNFQVTGTHTPAQDKADDGGGCTAGGSAGMAVVALLGIAARRRRRS